MSADLKELRASLAPYRYRPAVVATLHLCLIVTLYAAAFAGALLEGALSLRLLCGLLAGLFSGNLFMMGHDACHGSFTASPPLNALLGRVAFLPSYHPYSPWELSHNRVHHIFTNLKGRDFVWTPLTAGEYAARSPAWRWLYRAYRTPLGLALYYPLELWWPRLVFPRAGVLDRPRASYTLDSALVVAFALAQLGAVVAAARLSTTPVLSAVAGVLFAMLAPWAVFCWMIGFVTYFNHTHPEVPWFATRDEWSALAGTLDGTVHLRFPRWSRFFSSNIMNHVAHHTDPHVPLVRLHAAQAHLEAALPGRIVVQAWGVGALREIQRRCRLYDFERRCWTDYDGRATTGRLSAREAPRTAPAEARNA